MKGKGWLAIVLLGAVGVVGYRSLPSHYNPFVPLQLSDPPGWLTKFKLQRLTPQQRLTVCGGEIFLQMAEQ